MEGNSKGNGFEVRDLFQIATYACIGGAIAIIGYKMFLETEQALTRRLGRVRNMAKPVRIWIDGCFDMMHFGHANAFRQARALGDILIVGINCDEEITQIKGAPIMNDEERIACVAACKWVDKVVPNVPYCMDVKTITEIIEKYDIDCVVHGDDPCLMPDGSDVYATAKALGKFQTIKRTEGVSTTDLVGRMLLMTRDHHHHRESFDVNDSGREWGTASEINFNEAFNRHSDFLQTGRRITQFMHPLKIPKKTDKIVYIDGAWDMFHYGHIKILEEAHKHGDFLIVGVHPDHIVNEIRGSNFPIMNLNERVLSVLSCRFVDEVIIGAPFKITSDMMTTLNISLVICGSVSDSNFNTDPYEIPRELGKLVEIKSISDIRTSTIVERILSNRRRFEEKFAKKNAAEMEYLAKKKFVEER